MSDDNKYAKYYDDVKLYAKDYNEGCIDGVAKHCGIALQSRDASMVACSDPSELARIRDGFCRKKLERSEDDATLDEVIAGICEVLKADRSKARVTFYYLLAEHFGQLDLFAPKA